MRIYFWFIEEGILYLKEIRRDKQYLQTKSASSNMEGPFPKPCINRGCLDLGFIDIFTEIENQK